MMPPSISTHGGWFSAGRVEPLATRYDGPRHNMKLTCLILEHANEPTRTGNGGFRAHFSFTRSSPFAC